jgi:ribosomal protein L6P/L9E
MCNKLNMIKKIRYSSLLKIKNTINHLIIKGPLGQIDLALPDTLKLKLKKRCNTIILSSTSKKHFNTFVTSFENTCRSLTLGNLVLLELEGLGLKFIGINKTSTVPSKLEMGLGLSNTVVHAFDINCSNFFLKSSRSVLGYSMDYAYLQNEASTIFNLKVPDRYKQKGFKIKKFI